MMLPDDRLLAISRNMCRVRILENRLEENHKKGLVPGFFHSSVGQEASPGQTGWYRAATWEPLA